jgi:hypothetical protein
MKQAYKGMLEELRRRNWKVRLRKKPTPLPDDITARYPWIPSHIREFMEETDAVESPDDKSWFLTSADFSGESQAAFSWNQWELDSLDAAEDDSELQAEIRSFWAEHFPILMSVKSGYAYFAIRRQDLAIVQGEEPEYEESVDDVTDSFSEFMQMVALGDPRLERWI